ncbi:L-type lectin-domain containing receptor kinase IX.1 [Bienertia sinuspersici]
MSGSIYSMGSSLFSIGYCWSSIFQALVSLLFFLVHVHSLSFNFTHFDQENNITYKNDSILVNGFIQLTLNAIDRSLDLSAGRVSYSQPVRLWDKNTNETTNFTTHFSFKITQLGYNPDLCSNNSFGGCLGLVSCDSNSSNFSSKYPFVAIEFDTFNNRAWDPLKSDTRYDHLGIDVTSLISKAYVTWSGGVENETVADAWITYDSYTKNLSVYLTYDGDSKFNREANLSYVIDLSSILPEKVRVGFSSSTGTNAELHYILSWDFNSTLMDTIISVVPSSKDATYVGGLVAAISIITIGLAIGMLIWWRRRSWGSREDLNFMDDDFDQETWPKRFTYNELSRATRNFSEEGKLGQGGFGGVYRGFLTYLNRDIAVKKISSGSEQGKKEYMSEVKIVSRLRHKNLVQLLRWCHEQGNLFLVYEFMPNGSLDSHLYVGKREVVLPWNVRYKIAQDLASVLLYLHQEWEQCVLHRDIKSSNVMLDSNYNAKLGDFGLARLVDHNVGSQTTALAGTLGYLAPECVIAGKASKETDVYSFGVVALEIACGRRPVEYKEEPSKVSMVEWVWDLYGRGHLLEAVDKRLEGEFNVQELESLLMVGLWCSHPDHTSRPSIRQAIAVLDSESPLPSLPLKFPIPFYCLPQLEKSTLYVTPSFSEITGSSGTTSYSLSHSDVSGNASLLSDNVNTLIFQAYFVSFLLFLAHVHSVSFRFPSSSQNSIIDFRNDASISSGAIELTKSARGDDLEASVGRASYTDPVRLWDKHTNKTTNFTTHFSFKIAQVVKGARQSGDGLTFFLTSFNDFTANAPSNDSAGGCLGLISGAKQGYCNVTSYPFVAVEFDTFHNSKWDPGDTSDDPMNDHVGIDVNSVRSKVVLPVNGGLKNRTDTGYVWIAYDSSIKILSVYLTYDDDDHHPTFNGEYNLSYVIDLRAILPERVRVGFSSSTGTSYERHTILSWDFNSTLVDDGTLLPPIKPIQTKSKVALVGGLVAGVSVITIGIGLFMFIRWKRRSRASTSSNDDTNNFIDDDFDQETGPKRFTYNELRHATNNFSEEGKLGEGGFGGVYRGLLTDVNREIAVKKISRGSKQGKKEYVSEVKIISRLRHKNLVQLLGWCHEQGNLLLVYEFMPNGSLDSHIYAGKRKVVLPWAMRYKIAQDLASGLLYLHQDWEQCVLHRDIKSSNIMLDSNFNAKLGDFGLARLVDHNLGSQTTLIAGTLGYLDPECMMTGKASKESDVYSFGVVALEIACGRRPVESMEDPSKVNMIEWVWNLYGEGRLLEAVDKILEQDFDIQQIQCLMLVGLWCCHPEHTYRPSIRQVINVLNLESPLPSLPMKFPVPIYCSPQMNMSSNIQSSPSSSGLTGSSGTTSSSTRSLIPGTAPLLSDNVIV